MENNFVGIDLGTTTCYCTYFDHAGQLSYFPYEGNECIHSVISYTNSKWYIGKNAYTDGKNKGCTFFELKRIVGRKYDDQSFEKDMKHWPFNVVRGENDMAEIEYEVIERGSDKAIVRKESPESLISRFLKKIKDYMSNQFFQGVSELKAVITVPERFNELQVKLIVQAARQAGFDDVRVFSEPSAAGLAYVKANKDVMEGKNILVYDLGGGTFDISIIHYEGNTFSVQATDGDTHLGGSDVDSLLVDWYLSESRLKEKVELNKTHMNRIKRMCEDNKILLCGSHESISFYNPLCDKDDEKVPTLSRRKLREKIRPFLEKTTTITKRCVTKWKEKHPDQEIEGILMVGGGSYIWRVLSDKEREQMLPYRRLDFGGIDSIKAVSRGACLRGMYY